VTPVPERAAPPPVPERAAPPPVPERAEGESKGDLDLRILTPGLSEEEIAAVTSVIAAMLEEQRDAELREAGPVDRWRRSFDPGGSRGPGAWRWSIR